jgi:hypothetical protein
MTKFLIDAPKVAPATGGLLDLANVITADADKLAYQGATHRRVLGGQTRTVPVSAGAVAAPVLTKGTTATSGGTFGAGAKFWKVTAVTGYGETVGSNEVTATLVATGTQALSWAEVPGAQFYRVYRGTATGAENVLVAETAALTFIDTGAAGTAKAIPTVSTAGAAPAAVKVFDQSPGYGDSVEFQTYRGIEDAMLLGEDPAALARDAFSAGETFAVEKAVQSALFNPNAVDLTPVSGTGVTNAKAAMGLLEQWIAENYSGKPLLHTNRLGVELIFDRIVGTDPLITVNGTPVVSGAGYSAAGPGSVTAGPNEVWLYVTGQINLWQGGLNVQKAQDTAANRDFGLAERAYAATNSGPVAAILIGF